MVDIDPWLRHLPQLRRVFFGLYCPGKWLASSPGLKEERE
jgi:hypothetical protein